MKKILFLLMFPVLCFGQEVSDSVVWNQIFREQEFKLNRKQLIEDGKNDPYGLSSDLNICAIENYNSEADAEKAILLFSKAILILENAELDNDGYMGKYGKLSMLYFNRASKFNNMFLLSINGKIIKHQNPKVWNKVAEDLTKSIEYFKLTRKFKKIGFNKKKWNVFYHTKQFASSYNLRGNSYLTIGDSDKALDDFDKAAVLYPKYYLRCEVFRNECNNNSSKACEYYNKHCK